MRSSGLRMSQTNPDLAFISLLDLFEFRSNPKDPLYSPQHYKDVLVTQTNGRILFPQSVQELLLILTYSSFNKVFKNNLDVS